MVSGMKRFPRHLWHLPRDYELAIRWLRPSFSQHEITGRPAARGRDIHAIAPVRYVDPGEAAFRAARSQQRAHVCPAGRRSTTSPISANARPGDRVRRAVPALAAPLRAKITSPMSATSPTSTTRSTTRAARDFSPLSPLNEAIRRVYREDSRPVSTRMRRRWAACRRLLSRAPPISCCRAPTARRTW